MLKIRIFRSVWLHSISPHPPAPFALADMPMTSTTVHHAPCGMAPQHNAGKAARAAWSTQQEASYAQTGNGQTAAPQPHMTPVMNVLDAGNRFMGLRTALKHKRFNAASPYNPEAWRRHLCTAGLQSKYLNIPNNIRLGFDAGIQPIFQTFTPQNHPSITKYSSEFNKIVQTEFQKGHYIGPVTQEEVEFLLGAFQTSPLSIIPKPG